MTRDFGPPIDPQPVPDDELEATYPGDPRRRELDELLRDAAYDVWPNGKGQLQLFVDARAWLRARWQRLRGGA